MSSVPRPFLKWAGGKAKLMPQLRPLLPKCFGRYHEPFNDLGSDEAFATIAEWLGK